MIYTREGLYREMCGKAYDVYLIFKDKFGDEYVDLQGGMDRRIEKHLSGCETEDGNWDIQPSLLGLMHEIFVDIMVWWPKVTVTNEYGKSVVITDLFAKVSVYYDGKLRSPFTLNRSSYTLAQFESNYMHSHISSIPKGAMQIFQTPCLGNGPLVGTEHSLQTEEYDELTWMLFCEELALYVTVESIKGVPYHKLETIIEHVGMQEYVISSDCATSPIKLGLERVLGKGSTKKFMLYYLEKGHLKINYRRGKFVLGMSNFDFMLDISNAFIEFFNANPAYGEKTKSLLMGAGDVKEYYRMNNKLYIRVKKPSNLQNEISNYEGRFVCYFKGKPQHLKIINEEKEAFQNPILLFSVGFSFWILNQILRIINYNYGNKEECAARGEDSQDGEPRERKRAFTQINEISFRIWEVEGA